MSRDTQTKMSNKSKKREEEAKKSKKQAESSDDDASLYSDDEGRRNLYWDDLTLKTALDTIEKILSGKEIE